MERLAHLAELNQAEIQATTRVSSALAAASACKRSCWIRCGCAPPTGNLDTRNGAAIMELLDEVNAEGKTICMVTHDARFAERAARRIELRGGVLART